MTLNKAADSRWRGDVLTQTKSLLVPVSPEEPDREIDEDIRARPLPAHAPRRGNGPPAVCSHSPFPIRTA